MAIRDQFSDVPVPHRPQRFEKQKRIKITRDSLMLVSIVESMPIEGDST